jgi:hypothetical protein
MKGRLRDTMRGDERRAGGWGERGRRRVEGFRVPGEDKGQERKEWEGAWDKWEVAYNKEEWKEKEREGAG